MAKKNAGVAFVHMMFSVLSSILLYVGLFVGGVERHQFDITVRPRKFLSGQFSYHGVGKNNTDIDSDDNNICRNNNKKYNSDVKRFAEIIVL
ncbi:hypothetical protein KIN20_032582 [Parelaphostrongylus tenuis]|uniref:Uncharacterized protein n=1 Tax=Parelaphostrongylus tenuis TaxID=148309 RepID=A0AAD5WI65_PARTN|nr:hypothetical protein KIN20_032582 [Parelaphostrongylus tenuis]